MWIFLIYLIIYLKHSWLALAIFVFFVSCSFWNAVHFTLKYADVDVQQLFLFFHVLFIHFISIVYRIENSS